MIPEGVITTKEGWRVLKDDTHLSRWIEEHGRLDVAHHEIERYFAKYIPKGGTVIDAGASLGDHTTTYADLVGPRGKVWAFEPNPDSFFCLQCNMGSAHNTTCINRGLSDMPREGLPLILNPNIGASHIALKPSLEDGPSVKVDCFPLDTYIYGFERVDFIHLDVEGFEAQALIGATRTISKFRPVIVLELNKGCMARTGVSEPIIRELLTNVLGYIIEEVEPDHGPHMEQRDIICIPRS